MSKAAQVEAPVEAIDRLAAHANRIATGNDPKVKPGQTERFTAAASHGDTIRQGDLYLIIREYPGGKIPEGYTKRESKPGEDIE